MPGKCRVVGVPFFKEFIGITQSISFVRNGVDIMVMCFKLADYIFSLAFVIDIPVGKTAKGKPMAKGTCPECSTKVNRFLSQKDAG